MTQANMFVTTAAEMNRHVVVPGKERARAGKDKAIEHEHAEWLNKAFFLAKAYVASLSAGSLFATEDIRAYYAVCRLPDPHHHNVYGGLLKHFQKRGLAIEITDQVRSAHSARTHGKDVSLWRKTSQKSETRDQQQLSAGL